jgi:hypothetical protein
MAVGRSLWRSPSLGPQIVQPSPEPERLELIDLPAECSSGPLGSNADWQSTNLVPRPLE